MNVILHHPKHGTKVAICDAEVAHDLKQGWSRGPLAPQTIHVEPVNELRRKPGRPRKEP